MPERDPRVDPKPGDMLEDEKCTQLCVAAVEGCRVLVNRWRDSDDEPQSMMVSLGTWQVKTKGWRVANAAA